MEIGDRLNFPIPSSPPNTAHGIVATAYLGWLALLIAQIDAQQQEHSVQFASQKCVKR